MAEQDKLNRIYKTAKDLKMRDLSDEQLEAILYELQLYKMADEVGLVSPDAHACACVGPMPECRCMKRKRLIEEAMEAIHD